MFLLITKRNDAYSPPGRGSGQKNCTNECLASNINSLYCNFHVLATNRMIKDANLFHIASSFESSMIRHKHCNDKRNLPLKLSKTKQKLPPDKANSWRCTVTKIKFLNLTIDAIGDTPAPTWWVSRLPLLNKGIYISLNLSTTVKVLQIVPSKY